MTDVDVREAAQLYVAGNSLAALGAKFDVDAGTVRRELLRAGIQMRLRRGWPRP